MSLPDLQPLQESLCDRIDELEQKKERAEKQFEGDGSTPATWRKVEPGIKKRVLEECLTDIEETEKLDDLLEVVAEWRRNVNQEWQFKTTNPKAENTRNSIKKAEIRNWVDELLKQIPDSIFETCGLCGSDKLPESDRRKNPRFTWKCPDCSI